MSPECNLIAILHGRPEKREELLAVLRSFVVPTRKEAGCFGYHLHVDASDANRFVFYENWGTRADLDVHLKQPHLAAFIPRADELLTKPIEMIYLTMLSPWPGR